MRSPGKPLPGKQDDLHGSAPASNHAALLLIDLINDFEFPRGDELFAQALPMAPRVATLKKRAGELGVSTNSCVLFTANDAYMRDVELIVPEDCVAACEVQEHRFAMEHMKNMLKADVRPSAQIDLKQFTA